MNGTFAEGAVYYLALGDSLAANVGVASAQDGYVSRVHRWLEERDGRRYGLLDLGVPGETSGSLLAGGQLDEALDFLAANRVAYITVDIGANDLLGHLTSPECSADLDAAACRARLDGALAAYEENLPAIFAALREAAPQATIVFLTAYNPFSLGTGIAFEEDTEPHPRPAQRRGRSRRRGRRGPGGRRVHPHAGPGGLHHPDARLPAGHPPQRPRATTCSPRRWWRRWDEGFRPLAKTTCAARLDRRAPGRLEPLRRALRHGALPPPGPLRGTP